MTWDNDKTYVPGQNVEYQGSFYRTKTQHISTETFDLDKFTKLPKFLIGGRLHLLEKVLTHITKKKK